MPSLSILAFPVPLRHPLDDLHPSRERPTLRLEEYVLGRGLGSGHVEGGDGQAWLQVLPLGLFTLPRFLAPLVPSAFLVEIGLTLASQILGILSHVGGHYRL